MSGFLEVKEARQADQLDNFASKIGGYAATLDITPAEIASAGADALYFRYVLQASVVFKAYDQSVSAYKKLLKKNPQNLPAAAFPPVPTLPVAPATVQGGVLDRFTNMGKRIKLHKNYTRSIGEDLWLIAPDDAIDVNNSKPVLTLSHDPAGVRIEFNLKGYFDGVNIYKMSPPDNPAFTFLVRDVSSPYIDATPAPPGTRYHAYYVIGDEEVGLVSDDAVVGA